MFSLRNDPIFYFMREVLRMDKSEWELFNLHDKGNEIQLRHLYSIWKYVTKQINYDDPKRHSVPENTLEKFK